MARSQSRQTKMMAFTKAPAPPPAVLLAVLGALCALECVSGGLFRHRPRELPCLRLRGGEAPRTPVTPGRTSRRLAHQSPELKNTSPSLLSGRQKKTRARVDRCGGGVRGCQVARFVRGEAKICKC
jgi:hypothetical protein